jgi:AraC family transcriptional regulator, transcriptional activator of pobA
MRSEIRIDRFKGGLPLEFEILSISDLYKKSKNLVTTLHRPEFYHIIWILKGAPVHLVDFNSIKLVENSILFVPKDCVNRWDSNPDYDGKVILFTDKFFCKEQGDLNFLQSTILYNDLFEISMLKVDDVKTQFIRQFELIADEYNNPSERYHYEILRNHLHNFMLYADREKGKQGYRKIEHSSDLEYMMRFKDLLGRNFSKYKSVNIYASDLNISSRRLNQATVNILGKSAKQLIDERILLESKRLLTFSVSTIKEISFHLGFDEPTNFIKYFHKHEHVTPIDFRKNYHK